MHHVLNSKIIVIIVISILTKIIVIMIFSIIEHSYYLLDIDDEKYYQHLNSHCVR